MKISLPAKVAQPLLATALAALVAFGCTDQGSEPPTSPLATPDLSARAGQSSASASQQDLGPALAAQKRHGDRLMAIAGVLGHGVGLVEGEPGIKVFLLKPGVAAVPARLDDVPVAVEVTGMFVAGGTTDKTSPNPTPNGWSVGHPDITAGTLGAVVRKPAGNPPNQCYILSNNHVLANSNDASPGDYTLQPGPFDGGQDPEDAIATLSAFEPIAFDGSDNTIDAAISAVFSPAEVTGSAPEPGDSPPAYGAPSEAPVVVAGIGLDVQKFGRTTLWTHGRVDLENVTANICYECGGGPFCRKCNKLARFVGLVSIPDAGATDAVGDPANFSGGGDSGSLIVTEVGNNPTAHLFAGNSTRTLATQIGPVLNQFNVKIETDVAQCADGGVAPPPDVTDIAVTAVFAPASVTQGNVVSVDVTVENVGNQDVTSDINVVLTDDTDGVTINTQTIAGGLTASTSATLTYSWDTGAASLGDHTLTASLNFVGDDNAANDSKSIVTAVNEPSAGVTVSSIDPNTMQAGTTIDVVTIVGSGFAAGTSVSFENGSGPAPTASNVVVVDASTITATVTAKGGGPRRNRVWDVRVTNLDNSFDLLVDGFTVTP